MTTMECWKLHYPLETRHDTDSPEERDMAPTLDSRQALEPLAAQFPRQDTG